MANAQSIKNWHIGNLLSLLTQNPGVQFFNITVIEYPFATYPQGVPRSALINEFNSKADIANQQNGNLGLLRQVYGLANLPATINVPPSPLPITTQSQVS
jgi:hypothetical protein